MNEVLDKAKALVERARNAIGRDKVNAVFECQGVLMDAGLGPELLLKIGTNQAELNSLIVQGDKETAVELLEKARSSEGDDRSQAALECKGLLEVEASKRKGIEGFTPEDIGTTVEELDSLIGADVLKALELESFV